MNIYGAIKKAIDENDGLCMDVKSERARLFKAIKKKMDKAIREKTFRYTITMASDIYGGEDFDYDSFDEALAGLKRLRSKVMKLKDGVDRTFTISMSMEV